MRRLRALALFVAIVGLTVVVLATTSSRQALAVGSQTRTFVATTGSDANPCSRTAPCRTFGAALAQTASGGEIVALDSGGYGAVTITQAVTIAAAPGVQASISPASGSAITVNAGASDAVVLRNLQLNGQGATYGVEYQAGGSLFIESLTINGFTNTGVFMNLASSGHLHVTDTVVRKNGYMGLHLFTSSGIARATILRTRLEANYGGLWVDNGARVSVNDSVASGNSEYGFLVYLSGAPAEVNLEDCVASEGRYGVYAYSTAGTASLRVSNCLLTANDTGILIGSNGSILSRGNNTVEGNTTNGTFSGTYAAK